VLVADSGSMWSNAGTVLVGRNGDHNSMVISNGAEVFAQAVTVRPGWRRHLKQCSYLQRGLLDVGALTAAPGGQPHEQHRRRYQFTSYGPAVTTNANNHIYISNAG